MVYPSFRSVARATAIAGAVMLAALTGRAQASRDVQTSRDQIAATQPPATAAIMGTVMAADSGQPVDGVRVSLSGGGLRGSRSISTDDDGRFAFAGLPAGTVNLSASKAGYVSMTYGQSRPGPGQAGTPIALAAGQQMKDVVLRLPRGGVITGTVFDEKGRPVVNAPVRVSRWVLDEGERSLVSTGSSSTDDRGMYRIFGLAPGTYVAHTAPRTTVTINADIAFALEQAQVADRIEIVTNAVTVMRDREIVQSSAPDAVTTGFAEVYYPGSTDVASAAPITIGPGEERPGVDLRLQRVRMAPVSGQILMPPGVALSNVQVRLARADAAAGGSTSTARAGQDGAFRLSNVAPGRYRVSAMATSRRQTSAGRGAGSAPASAIEPERYWGIADLVVDGAPVTGLTVALQPGLTMTGRVAFDGSAPPPAPDALRRVRLTLSPTRASSSAGASRITANVGTDGQFRLTGLVPGEYEVRASGAGGWFAQSAIAGGRDALDFLLAVSPESSGSTMLLTFTDRRASLAGTLQDQLSRPTADYTIVLFAAEPSYWVPRSRRILATRPSTDGKFSFGDVPPGSYRLAAVTGVEPGSWFDPELLRQWAGASVPVLFVKGEAKTQDLRVAGR